MGRQQRLPIELADWLLLRLRRGQRSLLLSVGTTLGGAATAGPAEAIDVHEDVDGVGHVDVRAGRAIVLKRAIW